MKTLGQILTMPRLAKLKGKKGLASLMAKALGLTDLERLLLEFLDTKLARHCRLAAIDDKGVMLIVVDNASWATRLRYAIPEILKTIKTQPEFTKVKKIRYSIQGMLAVDEKLLATNSTKSSPKKNIGRRKTTTSKLSPESEQVWQATLKSLRNKLVKNK